MNYAQRRRTMLGSYAESEISFHVHIVHAAQQTISPIGAVN